MFEQLLILQKNVMKQHAEKDFTSRVDNGLVDRTYCDFYSDESVFVAEEESLADALTGGIGLDNRYTFDLTKELVDEIVLVSEKEIAAGIHHAYWHESQIVEGAGAVAIASLLANKFSPKGPSLALMCGRNINIEKHFSLISAKH